METAHYKDLQGLDTLVTPIAAPQITFLSLINYHVNRELGTLIKRDGSNAWNVFGDIWGIGGFAEPNPSLKVPVLETIVRHRRVSSESVIEKLNWTSNEWEAIAQGAHVSFNIEAIADIMQANDSLIILASRPAMITDISTGSVLRLGGPSPTEAPTVAPQGSGSITGTNYTYVYTFYDSTTGWESSPSTISATISPDGEDVVVSGLETSVAKEGVDKKRIYRTITAGELPHRFVTEIPLATTSYTDSTADADLGLETAPLSGDHDPPPEPCYVGAFHQSRMWLAKGNEVWYSLPDDGTGNPLQYFSSDRVERFPTQVTGLTRNRLGGLYVFSPPGFGINEIQGRTDTEFFVREAFPFEGTHFHKSIAVGGRNDDTVAFWGVNGPTFITPNGINSKDSEKIRNIIRDPMIAEYNQGSFLFCQWDRANTQFIFGLALQSTGDTLWREVGTSISVQWKNISTGQTIPWEPVS